MVTYRIKNKKRLKYKTYKKHKKHKLNPIMIGGNDGNNLDNNDKSTETFKKIVSIANPLKYSPFAKIVNLIKDMTTYSMWSFLTMPIYFSSVAMNTPFNSLKNITNKRLKGTQMLNQPIYKTFTPNGFTGMDKTKLDVLTDNIKTGKLVHPYGYTYEDGYITKGGIMKGGDGNINVQGKLNDKIIGVQNPLQSQIQDKLKIPLQGTSPSPVNEKVNNTQGILLKGQQQFQNFKSISPSQTLKSGINKVDSSGKIRASIGFVTGNRYDTGPSQFQQYYKNRYLPNEKDTVVNFLKSKIEYPLDKSVELLQRDYSVYGRQIMNSIYQMPVLDDDRIRTLELYMRKIDSTVLLKTLILFNTIFGTNEEGLPKKSEKCSVYLEQERKLMGIGDNVTVPTYYNPLPIIRVKNPYKYKNTINISQLTLKNFKQCLKSTITKSEFDDDDLQKCFDPSEAPCKDCTLHNNFFEIIKRMYSFFSDGISLHNMINSLFYLLIKVYGNVKYNNEPNKKEFEKKLLDLYFNEINTRSYDVNRLIQEVDYKFIPTPKKNGEKEDEIINFEKIISSNEVKMFKDLMCKYKLIEKIELLYKQKREEELKEFRKKALYNPDLPKTSYLVDKIMDYMSIFMSTSEIRNDPNKHLSITDINDMINQNRIYEKLKEQGLYDKQHSTKTQVNPIMNTGTRKAVSSKGMMQGMKQGMTQGIQSMGRGIEGVDSGLKDRVRQMINFN
jgi:hypothetical protein